MSLACPHAASLFAWLRIFGIQGRALYLRVAPTLCFADKALLGDILVAGRAR